MLKLHCLFPPNFSLPIAIPHERMIDRMANAWSNDLVVLVNDKLPKLIVVLIVAYVLYRIIHLATRHLHWLARQDMVVKASRSAQLMTLASVVETAGIGIVAFIAVMHTLEVFNIDAAPLLASAGVAGLAIGFGAQTIVHDVINGMLILLENQFNLGDVIKAAGFLGTVEQMSLRRTVLRDGSNGTIYVIPNSQITTVSNYSRDWSTMQINVSVDYREDADRILALLKTIAQQIVKEEQFTGAVMGDPTVLGVDSFKGSEVIYPVVFRTKANMQWDLSREYRRRVKMSFEQQHILPGDPLRVFRYPDEEQNPAQ
ncbi:MAG: mechanosensitive ion channel family protein [Acidobacteriaceae bacterium]